MPTQADAQTSGFDKVATFQARGGVPNAVVGPGPTPGSQRLYQSYMYVENTLEIVAVDPQTGESKVYTNPAPTESGAWGLTAGDDGKIYVGTLPHAHLLQLDPQKGTLTDLGRPSATEQYIWSLTVGADHKIYGCTYPHCKLVRYDPATGRSEDLGRLDPTEQYGRNIAASDDGYLYVGVGTSKMNVAAYHIATGTHEEIIPAESQKPGIVLVFPATDGKIYSQVGDAYFELSAGKATRLPADAPHPQPAPKNRLADGRLITAAGDEVVVTDPRTEKEVRFPYSYPGRDLTVFRLGEGPDGWIYGSGILPSYLFHLRPADGKIETVGRVGGGESYSLLAHDGKMLLANYAGNAPLMSYDPARPFHPARSGDGNPAYVTFEPADSSWRPMAMIAGGDGKVYVGAVTGYGKLGGPLAVWEPTTHHVELFPDPIPDESIVSLAWHEGLIYGGTTVGGGGGSHPTQDTATLFVWDPATHRVVFRTRPVPKARQLTDLIVANGKLYGFADNTLFVFDPMTRTVLKTTAAPFQGLIYSSIAPGPDGLLWGLGKNVIFTVDPKTDAVRVAAHTPEPVYGGFVLQGHDLYFSSNATIYRYRLPRTGPQ